MRARRFWPPTKHKLLYANLIVYSVTLVLLLVFHHELIWAQKTLRGYVFSGNIPGSKDMLLIRDATRYHKAGDDVKSIQCLKQALQINPYSEAQLLLGLMQNDDNKMLDYYNRYRLIDPSVTTVYTHMVNILGKKQDRKAMAQLLTEGIKHFRRRIELYQPHYDPNVPKEFNLKALMVYNRAQKGLELLEKIQKQLNDSK